MSEPAFMAGEFRERIRNHVECRDQPAEDWTNLSMLLGHCFRHVLYLEGLLRPDPAEERELKVVREAMSWEFSHDLVQREEKPSQVAEMGNLTREKWSVFTRYLYHRLQTAQGILADLMSESRQRLEGAAEERRRLMKFIVNLSASKDEEAMNSLPGTSRDKLRIEQELLLHLYQTLKGSRDFQTVPDPLPPEASRARADELEDALQNLHTSILANLSQPTIPKRVRDAMVQAWKLLEPKP